MNWLLNLEDTDSMTEGFADFGFDSFYIINNMGTMIIFFVNYPFLMLL